ncbi:hypothetical protein B9Z55_003495 [Caenorhabditis nigoni]|uniref:Uncharacterized protein n=1 Tax=Caenorhabditis nigoni TaxID=1611254 RepID=A0A2G5VRA9_9PELO|nr:hypothetical protein B9Z55_003495 [Caenorhabditis nigoni]
MISERHLLRLDPHVSLPRLLPNLAKLTDNRSVQQFPKNLEFEFGIFFKKLRSYHRFLEIVIENLPIFLGKELSKEARKNLKIEQLIEALKGVRSVFEMFDSHKTKEVCQLVIRVGSFVKTCLHAMAIAEHLARDVEKSKDENDPLKAAFLKDLEGCGPILGKVTETIYEKKKLAQDAVQKLENEGDSPRKVPNIKEGDKLDIWSSSRTCFAYADSNLQSNLILSLIAFSIVAFIYVSHADNNKNQ